MQYRGSKNRLAKELAPIIQSYINEDTVGYLEPFVGGANLIDKIKCDNKLGSDIHKQLIELLKHAQNSTDNFPETISEEDYNYIKAHRDEFEDWYLGLVGFCCTYSNRYFNTYARGNDKRDRTNEAIRNIIKQSPNLKNIKFKCCDFREYKDLKGYVIYCDIPYKNTTQYNKDEFPYEDFYEWCKVMSRNNTVLISEYNMPDEFECIWEKEIKVLTNSKRKSNDDKNNKIERLYIIKG